MASDQDSVAFNRPRPHLCGNRLPKGLDVSLLEKLHSSNIHLPGLQCQLDELLGIEIDIGECGEKGILDESVHFRIDKTQLPGMI